MSTDKMNRNDDTKMNRNDDTNSINQEWKKFLNSSLELFKLNYLRLRCNWSNDKFLANILEIMQLITQGTIWWSQLGRLYAVYYYQCNKHMTIIKHYTNLSANPHENIKAVSRELNVMT